MKTKLNAMITSPLPAAHPRLRWLGRLTLSISACAWLGLAGLAPAQTPPLTLIGGDPNDYVSGELLIKFNASITDAQLADAVRAGGITRVLKHFTLKKGNETGILHVSTRHEVKAALRLLESHPAVEYVEPNYRLYLDATPNDPLFSKLWNLHNTGQIRRSVVDADIDAPEAWNLTTGDPDVIIAVIDGGIDIEHVDLTANIWTNPGETGLDSNGNDKATNGNDDDGNGYVDDVHGWDYWNGDNTVFDPVDGDVHGTHVAGIIAASGDNGVGVVGVNWHARILPFKAFGPEFGTTAAVVAGLQYAAAQGAKVINASFGGFPNSLTMKNAIAATGILFVASAGNNGSNNDGAPHYPSDFDLPNIISVAATTHRDELASFSNYGATAVDLGAPGAIIWSTVPGTTVDSYDALSGTSMAAPHVAGVAGLVCARFPNLTPAEVKHQILSSVDPIPALSGRTVTGGRLNAARALVLVSPPADPLHCGDLDGSSANSGKYWKATVVVTIHNGNEQPVQGATVSVAWSGGASGTASGTTDANGRCTFISGNISKTSPNATLTISNVTHATLTYSAAANHDPDGDSDGASITVNKP